MKCSSCGTDIDLEDEALFHEDESYTPPVICCSFCNKQHNEVKKLIAGPNVFICNECIDLCNSIKNEENK